ncbi:hypothetical protein ACWD5F_04830 [Streptomyces sp. NPDC002499]
MPGPALGGIRKNAPEAHKNLLTCVREEIDYNKLSLRYVSLHAKCCHGKRLFSSCGKVSEFLRATGTHKRPPSWKHVLGVQQILIKPRVTRPTLAQYWIDSVRSYNKPDHNQYIADCFREVLKWANNDPSDLELEYLRKYTSRTGSSRKAAAGSFGALLALMGLFAPTYMNTTQPGASENGARAYINPPESVGSTASFQKVILHQDLAVQESGRTAYIRSGETIYLGCFQSDNSFAVVGTEARVRIPALQAADVKDEDWSFDLCYGPYATQPTPNDGFRTNVK